MVDTKQYVLFKRLIHGNDVFDFKENNRTIIVGHNGSGKTTIANILMSSDDSVITEGNRSLIHKYPELIFIGFEVHNGKGILSKYISSSPELKNKVSNIFNELLIKKHRDISNNLPLGERVILTFAFIFVLRELNAASLPLILDSPFGSLDRELRLGLMQYLNGYECQQILYLTPSEYDEKLGDVDYKLR